MSLDVNISLLDQLESLQEGLSTGRVLTVVIEDIGVWSSCILLLFGSCRGGLHKLVEVEVGEVTLGLDGKQVRQILKTNELLLVELLTELDVFALKEGTLSPQVVEFQIVLVEADWVTASARCLQLILDALQFTPLD